MPKPAPLILRDVRLVGTEGEAVDVLVAGGRIANVVPSGTGGTGEVFDAAEVVDLDGRWLMPGLVDHHVHFALWARRRSRLDVSGAGSASVAAALVAEHLAAASAPATTTFVARGFQDALWPDAPTAETLDAIAPARPVVVISHDLHSVWLNSPAAARYGASGPGLIREADAFAVERAVDAEGDGVEEAVADAVRAASARGVTGIVDFQMEDTVGNWARRVGRGVDGLRVTAGLYPEFVEAVHESGLRTGHEVPGTHGLVRVGALKLFADGSLGTRTALCREPYRGAEPATWGGFGFAAHSPQELHRLVADARAAGFGIAVHAIGDLAVSRALDAFQATGARGSIEHAQLVAPEDAPRFAALGVAAVVQPEHALDDRDIADAVWADRAHLAFPYGALHAAGAELRLSSDAPVAPLDPWLAISAAVGRTRDARPAWQGHNSLGVRAALDASVSTRGRKPLAVGAAADLIAIEAEPLTATPEQLRNMGVALTLVGGRVTYSAH